MKRKTLVLGASQNPSRYGYIATERLSRAGHEVIAVGKRDGKIGNTTIHAQQVADDDVDTVTLYLNPTNQIPYYNYILSLNPRRIIYNPGTENPDLMKQAEENGIQNIVGCTLVMLASRQY